MKGFILGAGSIPLFPAAIDDLLGSEKWGSGPTGVVLRQQGAWTYGALANHFWSFAGDGQRDRRRQAEALARRKVPWRTSSKNFSRSAS